ncbi:MAG: LLM class F420-dependent oxidoreductase [Pseudomonadales bacterium]|jgi:probable F420-dependent oxidoreductase|nr:LLM class F420-dependent oxidoreductase [Pseudomonadales bacterium]MDP7357807.1 LLM class F420-dependent oxidoreductase [Pseudomonadales bacterium]MDP7596806.1 LLM class F420-dependent oxidoreductase [Pseudomonadales bacterium]HJN51184.1 LLM class F420-dependent oxidoreductase [Pseudomonadales bacterium]|tara:strand:+ start:440 stop:1300 length:861 start_codon:yes stop_codon:yes gene_type:complete
MKIGAVFPQIEIGDDPDIIARFATTAEELGYDHIIAYDHVLGAGTANRPDWAGPYTSASMFHEPFVLYGYLGALTSTLELVTAVIILPQRQTVLVAKQAASLAVLTKGRLRLGIGTGWNTVEYDALGESFTNRGARSEEQIDVMRKLWADEVISYDGKWHNITEAGLNPLPARQIPIWLGGMAEKVIDRVGRIGDGWFPFFNPNLQGQLEQLHAAAKRHGRDPNEIGIEVMTPLGDASDKQLDQLKKLRDMGVTHSAVVTMSAGLQKEEHIDAIKRFWDAAGSITD